MEKNNNILTFEHMISGGAGETIRLRCVQIKILKDLELGDWEGL